MSDKPARDGRRDDNRPGKKRYSPGSGGRGGSGGGRNSRGRRAGGADRRGDQDQQRDRKHFRSAPSRQGYREERMESKANEPDLPEGLDLSDLDPLVWQDLRVLSKANAEAVGKHMLMAANLIDDAPELALAHARAAKGRAGRVAIAREVNGVTAYRAGEWKEALSELRAARRIGGGPGLLALMADSERGLGRPEKALELGRSEEARQLDPEARIELAIVVAGARHDLGQHDSAVLTLERLNPDQKDRGISAARLSYAYANALALAGRTDEAKEWFSHTVEIDEDELTDASERLTELG